LSQTARDLYNWWEKKHGSNEEPFVAYLRLKRLC
jgi:hypothetical protein